MQNLKKQLLLLLLKISLQPWNERKIKHNHKNLIMFHFPNKRSITSLEKLWLWRGWELWALWCRKGAVARHRKWVGPISQRSTFRFHLLRLDIFTRWASFQSYTPVHTMINRGFPTSSCAHQPAKWVHPGETPCCPSKQSITFQSPQNRRVNISSQPANISTHCALACVLTAATLMCSKILHRRFVMSLSAI